MARGIIINVHSATISAGLVTIVIGTKRAQHLWLYYGCEQPTWKDNRKLIRNRPRIHAYTYTFYAQFHIAQQESGDTILHTFQFQWPNDCTRVYYMFADYAPLDPHQSVSPIFAIERQVSPAFAEDWQLGFTGRYPWSWTHNGPASKIDGPGEETVIIDPGWGESSISVSVAPYIPEANRRLDNVYIAVEILAAAGAGPTGNTSILLAFNDPNDILTASLTLVLTPEAEPPSGSKPPGPTGHGAGSYVIDPEAIAHSPEYIASGGTIPADNWHLTFIGFRAASGSTVLPTCTAHLTVGVITVGQWSETLRRVDASWRIETRPDALFFNAPDGTFYPWKHFPP